MSWQKVMLKEVGVIYTGSTPKTNDASLFNGEYPFVTPSDLFGAEPIVKTDRSLSEKGVQVSTLLPAGSVLVCCIGSLGKIGIAGKSLVTNQQINAVVFDSSKVDYRYGYYACAELKKELQTIAPATTVPIVNKSRFSELKIPLPPLAEQKRIAAILDKADEIRRKREQTIAKLDQLAQSIFVEMFGNAAINDKGWDLGKIGDLLESATYGTSEKSNAIGSYAVLRMNNITKNGAIDMTDLKYMDLEEKHLDRFLVQAGDVLFNRTNSADLVGKTAIYRSNTPVAYAGYLIRLRVNHKANAEYLASYLNTKYAKKELRSMCKSIIGMANINAKEIQAMRIPIPPLALQDQFAYRIKEIEALKIPNIAALTQQTQLFASLQHQAFTGNL
jgi:type I restriction enzyme S subunit